MSQIHRVHLQVTPQTFHHSTSSDGDAAKPPTDGSSPINNLVPDILQSIIALSIESEPDPFVRQLHQLHVASVSRRWRCSTGRLHEFWVASPEGAEQLAETLGEAGAREQVLTLHFSDFHFEDGTEYSMASRKRAMAILLAECPAMVEISLGSQWRGWDQLYAALPLLRDLKRISCTGKMTNVPREMLYIISRCGKLSSLDLGWLCLDFDFRPLSPTIVTDSLPRAPAVTALKVHLDSSTRRDCDPLTKLIHTTSHSLTSLSLGCIKFDVLHPDVILDAIAPVLANLESFQWGSVGFGDWNWNPDLSCLSEMINLRQLDVDMACLGWPLDPDSLRHLPSLTHLSVQSSLVHILHPPFVDEFCALLSSPMSRRLKYLEVEDITSHHMSNGYTATKEELRQGVEKLRSCGNKYGVELSIRSGLDERRQLAGDDAA
ncbi:hypothetical protein P7C70_g7220, partial [Phenoliferia sp. Uapishka_3]